MIDVIIMRNVPFEANGIKCLISEARLVNLRHIVVKIVVSHRVGQLVSVTNRNYHKDEVVSREYSKFWCVIDTTNLREWADGTDIYNYVRSTFNPVKYINLEDERRASKELLIIMSNF